MKKKILILLTVILNINLVISQATWEQLYSNYELNDNNSSSVYSYIEFSPDNDLYLLETEHVDWGDLVVRLKKQVGINWEQLGQDLPRITANNESHLDFVITPSNKIYIGMLDTIYVYNEVDELWESYYTPEFRGGLVSDENNNIYFISVQAGASGPAYYDLILNQFDNGTVTQATLIAEDVPVPPRVINHSNKIIIKNGQFYVSVVTQSSNFLYFFKGTIADGFTQLEENAPIPSINASLGLSSMAVNNAGEIFVSNKSSDNLLIHKYDETNDTWMPFDTTGIQAQSCNFNILQFDKNDDLNLIYTGSNGDGFVFKYNGTEWEHYGNRQPSESFGTISSIHKPWMIFDDDNNLFISFGLGSMQNQLRVLKYSPTANIVNNEKLSSQIHIFPNPASEIVHINNIPENATLRIIDLTGKVMYEQKGLNSFESVNISGFTNGVYLVQIKNKGSISNKKLIVNQQ